MKTALLIIDVQQDLFRASNPVYKAEQFIANLNDLAERARKAGAPVVYIQHDGTKDLIHGTDGWQLHSGLHPQEGDLHIYKPEGNSFAGTPLGEELKKRGITRVVVTGMVTHGCVKNTTLGALELGYETILVKDAHSNFSAKAADLITKWNAQLAAQGAVLKTTAEITFE